MNRLTTLLFALMASASIFAQINYEPGYYVNSNGTKIQGLIRNVAWKDNPVLIDFKAAENASSEPIPISSINEFAVGEGYLYRKFDLKYDASPRDVGSLSSAAAPIWTPETALIKVIVQGNLTLYEYSNHNLTLFFIADSPEKTPEQLVFKEYNSQQSQVAQNNFYRQQLYNAMLSKGFGQSDFERLSYNRQDLAKIVSKYNGDAQQDKTAGESKGDLNLRAIVGAGSAKLDLEYEYVGEGIKGDFGSKIVPVLGFEAEYVFGFNQRKWAVFSGATFQSYSGDDFKQGSYTYSPDYKFIEVPVGIRHSFFIGNEARIFVNVGYAMAFNLDSSIGRHNDVANLELPPLELARSSSLMAGVGFAYSRFALEIRLNGKRDVMNLQYWDSHYTITSAMLSYKIF